MTTYVLLLRGIGLGRNRLPMKDLVALLQALGLEDVRTYIQTGNAVFRAKRVRSADLAETITERINEQFDFAPRAFILTRDELAAAIAANPFPEAEAEPKSLHLTFLTDAPVKPDLDGLRRLARENERFALKDRVFYVHAPDGIGRSKLAERNEKLLGVPGTARNWRSATAILALADALEP